MTKQEFFAGWALLTIQPWGKLYRGHGPEATIQAELYYRHVNQAHPVCWQSVCEAWASGEKWPSLSELKESLRQVGGWVKADQRQIEHNPIYEECPQEVREKLRNLGVQI